MKNVRGQCIVSFSFRFGGSVREYSSAVTEVGVNCEGFGGLVRDVVQA